MLKSQYNVAYTKYSIIARQYFCWQLRFSICYQLLSESQQMRRLISPFQWCSCVYFYLSLTVILMTSYGVLNVTLHFLINKIGVVIYCLTDGLTLMLLLANLAITK